MTDVDEAAPSVSVGEKWTFLILLWNTIWLNLSSIKIIKCALLLPVERVNYLVQTKNKPETSKPTILKNWGRILFLANQS